MRGRRGLSIAEIVLAIVIIFMAFMVFMSVFSSSSRSSVQSRNRTAAILLANSLIDEFEAHPYGAKSPRSWTTPVDQPVRVWVQGRTTQMDFHKKIEFANGSFVGSVPGAGSPEDDVCTVTISWREGIGDKQSPVVVADDNKVLQVSYPVWR